MKESEIEKKNSNLDADFDKQRLFENLLKIHYPMSQDTSTDSAAEQTIIRAEKKLTIDELIEKYANEL